MTSPAVNIALLHGSTPSTSDGRGDFVIAMIIAALVVFHYIALPALDALIKATKERR